MTPNLIFLGDGPNMDILRRELRQDGQPAQDNWVVLFEVQRLACPYELTALLEGAENKRLLLVAVTPLAQSDDFHLSLEKQVLPFLPEKCRYLGLKLIPGAMEPERLIFLLSLLKKAGQTDRLSRFRQAYKDSRNHPDAEDTARLRGFIGEVFQRVS